MHGLKEGWRDGWNEGRKEWNELIDKSIYERRQGWSVGVCWESGGTLRWTIGHGAGCSLR
eukprot:scaffold431284_cov29-Prasinocladus_malaysianus.AAC.1